MAARVARQERAALVGLIAGRARRLEAERSLDELAGLAQAAGADVVLRVLQERAKPDPSTFLGSGKIETLAASCAETGVDVVIFDNELTPAQLRQIEEEVDRKIVDRTQLILDIFARRARTREGKLQVELAQLKYLLPRLVGASDALSRLGGGIGTRGPGETKLETDRRRIRTRIHAISTDIEQVRRRRAQLRERRHKASVPTVALVGYTNAGKTTLFNVLTKADAEASNALFVTLDPLVRQVRLPDSRELLVSDTVGFIDRLPHALVAAFRATLEEVADADLILHVIDAAATDRDRRMDAVQQVLEEVGATEVPLVEVYNKCDALTVDERRRLEDLDSAALCISALERQGIDELVETLTSRLALDVRRVTLTFNPDDPADRERIARVYRHARVVLHETRDGRVSIVADVPRRLLSRLGSLKSL
ncbi:MAG: GTPase HflX [Acidobacteria bacterium 13_1_40CM_65_14]|nr:MAG: GTPase HflX [Acidobacteria bacterium 13_1_40CM_65_14]OLC78428.1 MAG: GTPase HflX [Acidobacteria bacterium 13_1_40CM_4_65_8]OLE81966.1 MAG: GTPase HflX [Acidobacteria bacterium 13_1_20CM_2_65_9]